MRVERELQKQTVIVCEFVACGGSFEREITGFWFWVQAGRAQTMELCKCAIRDSKLSNIIYADDGCKHSLNYMIRQTNNAHFKFF